MEEPLVEFYYDKLQASDNKIAPLVNFYRAMFPSAVVDGKTYGMIGRLINVFGSEIIFMSILDCADVEVDESKSVMALISYFAKKRIERKFNFNMPHDLTKKSMENISRMTNG